MQGCGLTIPDFGFRVYGFEFKVSNFGFRIQGRGFGRYQGRGEVARARDSRASHPASGQSSNFNSYSTEFVLKNLRTHDHEF